MGLSPCPSPDLGVFLAGFFLGAVALLFVLLIAKIIFCRRAADKLVVPLSKVRKQEGSCRRHRI